MTIMSITPASFTLIDGKTNRPRIDVERAPEDRPLSQIASFDIERCPRAASTLNWWIV